MSIWGFRYSNTRNPSEVFSVRLPGRIRLLYSTILVARPFEPVRNNVPSTMLTDHFGEQFGAVETAMDGMDGKAFFKVAAYVERHLDL